MIAEKILSRLEKVRRMGPDRWLACCPAHGDSHPSLTIRETGEGSVLMHCFVGCDNPSIMASIGLEMSDLFDQPLADYLPRQRHPISPREALNALLPEIFTVALIGRQMLDGKHDPRTHEVLMKACERISAAHSYAEGL